MAGLQTILGVAQALLPANSPWRQKIEQAAKMASQFAPTKDGVAQLMAANGKRRSDLLAACKQLENPTVQRVLSYVPGLGDAVRNAASELQNDQSFGNAASAPYDNQQHQTSSVPQNPQSVNGDIWERINKL